ncbi:barstar family protein [Streptomyces sp. NPDC059761]|uniref:barstar family protein n=1 Tax=Streptomyces sp. NPDC059761 TaxID=3346937 RepID=UPI0036596609
MTGTEKRRCPAPPLTGGAGQRHLACRCPRTPNGQELSVLPPARTHRRQGPGRRVPAGAVRRTRCPPNCVSHHLDGRFVTDVPGLHCAIAEALLGPGRYFGREWNAFKDCLGGGFGVAPPFTLIWHDFEIARRALADVVEDPEDGLSYFEDIVRLLERCGVTVVLR